MDIAEIKQALTKLRHQQLLSIVNNQDIHVLIQQNVNWFDQLLANLWQQIGFQQTDKITLIAVGGYGRSELFPRSDLDLLFIYQHELTTIQTKQISDFFQFLWDCKLKVGNAVRSLTECVQDSAVDMTILSNLQEGRYLQGDQQLFQQFQTLIKTQKIKYRVEFLQAKLTEQQQRYRIYANTSHTLEPDLKNSPGGLRDLHILFWLFQTPNLDIMLVNNYILTDEYTQLKRAYAYLSKVRFCLHLINNKYDNKLLFEHQLEVSNLLGCYPKSKLQLDSVQKNNTSIENMMSRLYAMMDKIQIYSHMLLQMYQTEIMALSKPAIIKQLENNFYLHDDNSISLDDKIDLISQPVFIFDLFLLLLEYPDSTIAVSLQRKIQLALSRQRGYFTNSPEIRQKFLQIFTYKKPISLAIVPMHKLGILQKYSHDWEFVNRQMQFDLFHTYTVDEHLIKAALFIEQLMDNQDNQHRNPICAKVVKRISNLSLLYITILYHDIGKGYGRDHSQVGAELIKNFAEMHGFNQQQVALMEWLVNNHLLMSDTAQKKDIYNPQVIQDFVNQIVNKEYLDYLICLTIADIKATNPKFWNDWKRGLFRYLYNNSINLIDENHPLNNASNIQQQAIAILEQQAFNPIQLQAIQNLWHTFPESYFSRNNPELLVLQTKAILQTKMGEYQVLIYNDDENHVSELFVYGLDKAGILYRIINVLDHLMLTVHSAQIITTENGCILDNFIITDHESCELDITRQVQLQHRIIQILNDEVEVKPILKEVNKKLQHFSRQININLIQTTAQDTELSIKALNVRGLLACITQVMYQENIMINNAKIITAGEKVDNIFWLRNIKQQPLTHVEYENLCYKLKRAIQAHQQRMLV